MTARLPPRHWTQTLFDVIPLVFEDPALAMWRRWFERFGSRYATATAVIAMSRHAADEGVHRLGIPPKKLVVIYPGVGAEFVPGPLSTAGDPPCISLVAEYSARKGFKEAFEVIAAVAEAGFPHRLRVAGHVPPALRGALDADLSARRHELSAAAVEHAQIFSWARSARAHADVFEAVAAS